jgi:type II secretory pathway pseudopilin PulG
MNKNRKRISKNTFTIIELLVVIGVIGILVALLFPVLSKARESGKQANCISNLKQIGLALLTYKENNNEEDVGWPSLLYDNYLSTGDIFKCPSDANSDDTPATDWLARIDNQHFVAYDRQGNTGLHVNPRTDGVDYNSYFYEFSDAKCDWNLDGSGLSGDYTWAQLKHIQLKQGGDEVHAVGQGYDPTLFPVIRCYWHIKKLKDYSPSNPIPNEAAPVMNVGFAGNFFMSRGMWEKGTWSP